MRGEIGEAAKKGHTKQEISKIDAETAVLETKRKSEKAQADAELTNRQTELNMGLQLAQIKAQRAAEARDAELQKEVEQKKAATELERLRAKDLVKSKIAKETAEQEADASYYRDTKSADSKAYSAKQDAEAKLYRQQMETKGYVERQMQEADATYHVKMREAEAIKAQAEAYKHLADAFGGPQGLLQYMMLKEGIHEKLALANAKAIQGLSPKITVWNTGDQSGSAVDSMAPIRNIMQNLPPLLSTINEQTGISPPSWMVNMPKPAADEKPKVNGDAGAKQNWEGWAPKQVTNTK
jgi:flotillin